MGSFLCKTGLVALILGETSWNGCPAAGTQLAWACRDLTLRYTGGSGTGVEDIFTATCAGPRRLRPGRRGGRAVQAGEVHMGVGAWKPPGLRQSLLPQVSRAQTKSAVCDLTFSFTASLLPALTQSLLSMYSRKLISPLRPPPAPFIYRIWISRICF